MQDALTIRPNHRAVGDMPPKLERATGSGFASALDAASPSAYGELAPADAAKTGAFAIVAAEGVVPLLIPQSVPFVGDRTNLDPERSGAFDEVDISLLSIPGGKVEETQGLQLQMEYAHSEKFIFEPGMKKMGVNLPGAHRDSAQEPSQQEIVGRVIPWSEVPSNHSEAKAGQSVAKEPLLESWVSKESDTAGLGNAVPVADEASLAEEGGRSSPTGSARPILVDTASGPERSKVGRVVGTAQPEGIMLSGVEAHSRIVSTGEVTEQSAIFGNTAPYVQEALDEVADGADVPLVAPKDVKAFAPPSVGIGDASPAEDVSGEGGTWDSPLLGSASSAPGVSNRGQDGAFVDPALPTGSMNTPIRLVAPSVASMSLLAMSALQVTAQPLIGKDGVGSLAADVREEAVTMAVPSLPVDAATVLPLVVLQWENALQSASDQIERAPGPISHDASASGAEGSSVARPALSLAVPQVATQLAGVLLRSAGEGTELSLAPEELGRVRLHLEPDAADPDRMLIMIYVERPDTLDLFRRHAGELADAIRAAGYSGADIGFGQHDHHRDADQLRTAADPATPAIKKLEVNELAPSSMTTSTLDLRL